MQRLLAAGADPNYVSSDEKITPLIAASARDHAQIASILVRAGARVDYHEGDGSTALHTASIFGFADVIRVLLRGGANPNEQDVRGWAPLHLAHRHENAEAVEELVKGGGDILCKAARLTPLKTRIAKGPFPGRTGLRG